MCKWTANLYRCKHFTLRITEPCVHGPRHPNCLGIDHLLLALRKHRSPSLSHCGVFDWCPHKCERLIEAGRHDELVARSQAPRSGETDTEMFGKMYLLAGHGEEVREDDYSVHGVGFGDFFITLTAGT
ncbi:hypothetical protein VMCG_09168 [Cytospora schulzeri]|uniref:Uncharacterized protein n=1 Tax=Cytospora schulzeri TaxID=448051 RepID=A0A423VLE8_9PEZI|nr:hypothetical protein VMCG_09168 [Valsa malicola]